MQLAIFGQALIGQLQMMQGGKYKPKVMKPQSNEQSYHLEDPPIFDSSVDLELRTQLRKMFNIANQEKTDYKHLKEPNKVKSSKFNILSNVDFTVLEGESLLEKQKECEVLETQTQEWRDIQDLYISKYKSETRCLSVEEKQALRLNVIDFLGKRGMNTLDCRRILSRLCKYLSVNDIYFHELIFQLKQRKAIKEAQQQFQEAFNFLQDLYREERTNLAKLAPKMAEDLFGKVVKKKNFPGNLIFRELERQQMAQNQDVKEEQLAQVHYNLEQTHK